MHCHCQHVSMTLAFSSMLPSLTGPLIWLWPVDLYWVCGCGRAWPPPWGHCYTTPQWGLAILMGTNSKKSPSSNYKTKTCLMYGEVVIMVQVGETLQEMTENRCNLHKIYVMAWKGQNMTVCVMEVNAEAENVPLETRRTSILSHSCTVLGTLWGKNFVHSSVTTQRCEGCFSHAS